eukprot:TRINITY_DN243_c0_g1_i1.p1 TRINITY_DN243_c0_g1~~TRINITY_DN243_c0_g1_i1.p1  ORF type:complete len:100 (-),score=24.93 TRINITY_DN243_c0_g1_i1:54-353(-)
MALPEIIIDGSTFDSVDGFYSAFERAAKITSSWGRNLDAFNDVLRGGFGTPDGGFVIVWKSSKRSQQLLGGKFDTLVEIIRDHGVGGDEGADNVGLRLE